MGSGNDSDRAPVPRLVALDAVKHQAEAPGVDVQAIGGCWPFSEAPGAAGLALA